MAKRKRNSDKRVNYVMICEFCGFPQRIPKHIIQVYFPIKGTKGIHCECCDKLNIVPDYLKKLSNEL